MRLPLPGVRDSRPRDSAPAAEIVATVSGINPSCAEIRAIHFRVASRGIPMPRRSWIRSQTLKGWIPMPERQPDAPPLSGDQAKKIRSFSREIDDCWLNTLSVEQADLLIAELTKLRREHTKKILNEYYVTRGLNLPGWVLDQACDPESKPFRTPESLKIRWGAFVILLCLLWATLKLLEAAHR